MLTLSPASARALHLAAQGLLTPPRRKATKADVLDTIRRMAQLQIDTIHVVARSPYLVLFSRLGDFSPHWLDEHLAEARLFEYWSHEACFLPIEQFGLMRYKMLDPSGMGWKYAAEWHEQNRPEIERLLARIREEGPVRSADFAREDGVKGNGWWDRKPEKRHLEVLFTTGDLMVSERRNFQRVYDVRERVLPDWDDTRDLPPREAVLPALLDYTCRALGVVRADWVADYY
ncbi:winged helix-turn-helix domain-containing protein, partial [Burkholderia sp. E168m30]